jgi:hypothetical protein
VFNTQHTDDVKLDVGQLTLKDKGLCFMNAEETLEPISDAVVGEILFPMKEEVEVSPHPSIPNLKSKVKTTYGRLLANLIVLTYPFGSLYPYLNEEFNAGYWQNKLSKDLIDDVITVEQTRTYFNQVYFLSSLTSLMVPSASEKSVTTHPDIPKRKRELLEKYKDKLDDPATISKIEQELIALDREWLKGDSSEGFYKSSKAFNITRKKMHVMQGGEVRLDGSGKMDLIEGALSEGWDVKDMVPKLNAMRSGSFSRGAETADAGVTVKEISRSTQNARISEDDCKDRVGIPIEITDINHSFYVGRYLVGKDKPLTIEDLKSSIGKTLKFRSPMSCKTEGTNFCKTCFGDVVSKSPQALAMLAVQLASAMMGQRMAAMHGRELLTKEYKPELVIS